MLEEDALAVLNMARSIKNTFAPINRTPPEVLSLIPDYCGKGEGPIKLTHVCRYWREILISRASLWTFLNCRNPYKTRVYIERSRGSPLEIFLTTHKYHRNAFLLTVPHIDRLKALTLSGGSGHKLLKLIKHLGSSAPLLDKLEIIVQKSDVTIKNALFGGNLSSLRELRLSRIHINLPWRDLSNLTTFDFRWVPGASVTQLLDCFEHAPLREIWLIESLPDSSDAPAERVVSLPHLRMLEISAKVAHSILLNHLLVPTGAFVVLQSEFNDRSPPIPDHLPRSVDNLDNISHITSIGIYSDMGIGMWFNGPSGGLYVGGEWSGSNFIPAALDGRIFWPLNNFRISTTERLAISQGCYPEDPGAGESGAYQILLLVNNLRILRLTDCIILSFVLALNPVRNASSTVVCPELEELVLIGYNQEEFFVHELLEMAKERAARGAKLSAISIISSQEFISRGVLDLEDYASRVEHRVDGVLPTWDAIPDVLRKSDPAVRALIEEADVYLCR